MRFVGSAQLRSPFWPIASHLLFATSDVFDGVFLIVICSIALDMFWPLQGNWWMRTRWMRWGEWWMIGDQEKGLREGGGDVGGGVGKSSCLMLFGSRFPFVSVLGVYSECHEA